MITLKETKKNIQADPQHWLIALMDFVDDFRYYKNVVAVREPFARSDEKMDALLACVAEYLCDELNITPPAWLAKIPACKHPWFVSGIENLKAITLVESPLRFRRRLIFVLENFLSRV